MPLETSSLNRICRGWEVGLKLVMDLVLSCAGLVLLSPLFLLIALCIKIDSKGPVLYKQERVGRDGKRFMFYKFRSMRWGSDEVTHRNYVKDLINGAVPYANGTDKTQVFKVMDDPRITRVGRFLRKTSIDELPQLINVVKGEMSLVGPRPPIPYEVEEYKDWHRKRLTVKPGLTGLWQVNGRSMLTFDQMVELDIQYIENWSIWVDVKVLASTIPAVVSARGAY